MVKYLVIFDVTAALKPNLGNKLFVLSVIGLLVLSGVACSATPEPARVVPDSTLVLLLADLHLVGAAVQIELAQQNEFLPPNNGPSSVRARDSVLSAYGLDSTMYFTALESYIEEPATFVELYSRVLDQLNLKRQQNGQDVLELEDR